MHKLLLSILFLGFSFGLFTPTAFAAPPANFQTTQIIGSGLGVTTGFEFAPDGRIFILQRTGKVMVYKNGTLLPTPFYQFDSVATGDRGLAGITFDPDFNTNHFVYFYYTGADGFNRLVRLDATGDTASGNPVVLYQTPTASLELHIGGTIQFGSDGKLYVSIGDNGTSANAQNLANPFGKILRLNKDGSIPSDNPFFGQSGKSAEIWAYGLRNPYRFQFDKTSGRLYVGDVGNDTWEEVNLVTKGANYGWPTCEGTCSNVNFTNPTFTYAHNGSSSAISGGPVYRGNMFPSSFQGKYFFGDYAKGFIKTLSLDANGNSTGVSDFDLSAGSVVDLKVAPDGSLYYITYIPARLYRVTYSTFNQTPTAKSSADKTTGQAPLTVNFSSNGSSDPENQTLTYNWQFGDGTTSTQANPTKIYNSNGTYIVELTVSDGTNSAQATPITIQVGTPPTINITTPANNSTYIAGDTISYSGNGTDANGNALPDSAFTTTIVFHHDTHIHPFLGPIQNRSGQFTIPTFGEPSPNTWYEIQLTGKDSNNVSATKSINIYPRKVDLTFNTSPANLQMILDGGAINTPQTLSHVIGFQRTLSVPALQQLNNQLYTFASWSDNGGITHNILTPNQNTTFTANFNALPSFKAEFFNNKALSGSPVLTRQDPKIDFYWGGSPGSGVNADNFSTRWTNTVYFAAGKYRFITSSDDGARLYIDNQLVIDKWIDQAATTYYADVDLTSGNHTLKLEYYDAGLDALAQLTWELIPSTSTPPNPTPTPTPTTTSAPTPTPTAPSFSGFKGEYWNTPNAGSAPTFPNTAPNLTRDDQAIDFYWNGSPGTDINVDHFVTRWTKQLHLEDATYRFNVVADDGIRVYVDNQLIIDKWIDQPPTAYTKDVTLTAGEKTIKVEYYENGWDATAKFGFIKIENPNPTPTPTPTPVPTPTATPVPTPTSTPVPTPTATPTTQIQGLTGEYFDNINLTNPKLKRTDSTINFNWGTGSPNSAIGADTFSVRWTGQVQPQYSQTYTFYTVSDDGVRLWVNNKLIVDKWVDQPPKEWSGTISLTANQKYDIKMEFYDNSAGAQAKLYWSSPSQSKQIIPNNRLFTNP